MQKHRKSTQTCRNGQFFTYTETKKFSNTSHIRIFITDIHVEINKNLNRFYFAVNVIALLSNTKYCKIAFVWSAVPVINVFQKDKMSIFWTISTCIRNGSGKFWWTFTLQRQFLDVISSRFAVKHVTRLDVIWIKRSFSGVSFISVCSISGGLEPNLFARNDLLFGKQLFYENQNEKQHNQCWNQLPPCQSLSCVRLW